jgi:hypothetical protein
MLLRLNCPQPELLDKEAPLSELGNFFFFFCFFHAQYSRLYSIFADCPTGQPLQARSAPISRFSEVLRYAMREFGTNPAVLIRFEFLLRATGMIACFAQVFSGEMGSGKTETLRLILNYIFSLLL